MGRRAMGVGGVGAFTTLLLVTTTTVFSASYRGSGVGPCSCIGGNNGKDKGKDGRGRNSGSIVAAGITRCPTNSII